MEWTTPHFEEISLNCEINSYASAEMSGQAVSTWRGGEWSPLIRKERE
jgi:coenzyme PQQ precursor peptide PqqA